MLAIWVKARIKAGERQRFLKAIEADALGSEGDEPGCLRFNVLQDAQDENVYYFYEVYKDEAALEAHRATPHYAVWKAVTDTLDGPASERAGLDRVGGRKKVARWTATLARPPGGCAAGVEPARVPAYGRDLGAPLPISGHRRMTSPDGSRYAH